MGLAGTAHQQAAEELGVPFIAGLSPLYSFAWLSNEKILEWFADLDYNDEGKLLITKLVPLLSHVTLIHMCLRL
jgi:UPF0271 protein